MTLHISNPIMSSACTLTKLRPPEIEVQRVSKDNSIA